MAKKVDIREFKMDDANELMLHMSVQSLLDMKAINARVCREDILETAELAECAFSVVFDKHLAFCVFFVPSADGRRLNMFLLATTEGYSKLKTSKEALFSLTNILQNHKICSIVYKGNTKFQSILKCNDFKFKKSIIFGKEHRNFLMFER